MTRWQLEQVRLASLQGVEGLRDQVSLLIPALEVLVIAGHGEQLRSSVRALTGLRSLEQVLANDGVLVAASVAVADFSNAMEVCGHEAA